MVREKFTSTDIVYKVVVLIQNGFAMSHNLEVYEKEWRYLLNMFPEVEKDVPPGIMDAIVKHRNGEKAVDVS
jgi:hypothetical protein